MTYIYDLFLNFNDNFIDFFEWNKKDYYTHFKKIYIFKVSNEDLVKIYRNKIKFDNIFLSRLKSNNYNNYYLLICDAENVIGLELDSNGIVTKKSSLMVDDELEILDIMKKNKIDKIKFKILKKDKIYFKTRNIVERNNFIKKELENANEDKINYLYFECFGKDEKNKSIALKRIKNIINKEKSKTYENLYSILKLTSINKK